MRGATIRGEQGVHNDPLIGIDHAGFVEMTSPITLLPDICLLLLNSVNPRSIFDVYLVNKPEFFSTLLLTGCQ